MLYVLVEFRGRYLGSPYTQDLLFRGLRVYIRASFSFSEAFTPHHKALTTLSQRPLLMLALGQESTKLSSASADILCFISIPQKQTGRIRDIGVV